MTILMRKADKFADIFDSPETIAQAQKDGYHVCTDEESNARDSLLKAGKTDLNSENNKIGLFALSKNKIIEYAIEKGLEVEAFKNLAKDEFVDKVYKIIKAKILEAGIKTAEEIEQASDVQLLEFLDLTSK